MASSKPKKAPKYYKRESDVPLYRLKMEPSGKSRSVSHKSLRKSHAHGKCVSLTVAEYQAAILKESGLI